MYLPRALQGLYELGDQLPPLGICQRFQATRTQLPDAALRIELADLSAVDFPKERRQNLEQDIRRRAVAVHPHLSRNIQAGVEGTVLWSLEGGAELEPLATCLRDCPDLPAKIRLVLDLWEGLAYLHGMGLQHGCICPGTLWAGSRGGVIGGLVGVGTLASMTGRNVVLQSPITSLEGHAEQIADPQKQDVHDLAQALAWLTEWPTWLEQVLLHAQATPVSASEIASRIERVARDHLGSTEMQYERRTKETTRATGHTLNSNGPMGILGTVLRGILSVVLTGALLLAIIALALMIVLGPAPELRTVPKVIGMSLEDGKARMSASQLDLKLASYDFSTTIPEGRIMRTDPYPGKLVRARREVRATVSRGRRQSKVPKLVGESLATATEKLSVLSLEIGQVQRRADAKAQDIVLVQDPAAGKVLPRSGKVNLVVSGGPEFGILRLADDTKYVFRTVVVTVPRGKDLQSVLVEVQGGDMERAFEDRLCRPGETLRVDVYGPEGARIRVKIEDEQVFSERL